MGRLLIWGGAGMVGYEELRVCLNQGFIVIELELSYEPSAHLRWHCDGPQD
eukprot:COSAG05_NODE_1293_length_5260_cov_2.373571_5_plen_51_part_00